MVSKSIFQDFQNKEFGQDIESEKKRFKAYEEKVDLSHRKKCDHKRVQFERGELRCPCGAAWQGPNLGKLYNLLKGGEKDDDHNY